MNCRLAVIQSGRGYYTEVLKGFYCSIGGPLAVTLGFPIRFKEGRGRETSGVAWVERRMTRTYAAMDLEVIWKRARADLVIPTLRGDSDVFLWEHSARIAQTAQHIARLPMIRSHRPDEAAIVAAALYHDAGWITCIHERTADRMEVLWGSLSEADHDQGWVLMESSLSGLLPQESLELAGRAIREMHNRGADLIEAQVVAEADSLDEFGFVALWSAIRRGAVEGKGVQALLDTWRRRKEYQFWTARLNDAFRFEPVRELARRRLEKFERFLEELEEQHTAADVAALISTRVGDPAHTSSPR